MYLFQALSMTWFLLTTSWCWLSGSSSTSWMSSPSFAFTHSIWSSLIWPSCKIWPGSRYHNDFSHNLKCFEIIFTWDWIHQALLYCFRFNTQFPPPEQKLEIFWCRIRWIVDNCNMHWRGRITKWPFRGAAFLKGKPYSACFCFLKLFTN